MTGKMADMGILLQVEENRFFKLLSLSGKSKTCGEYIVINKQLWQNGKRKACKLQQAIIENPYDFALIVSLEV